MDVIYWNYRILKRVEDEDTENEEVSLNVVEMYYQDDGSIVGWTKEGYVYAEDLAQLRYVLECMLESLDKPIYVEADLLAEAAAAREVGAENIFPTKGISIGEVIESLGLEQEDVDITSELNTFVAYLEPSQIEEEGELNLPRLSKDKEIEDVKMGRYPAKVNRPSDRPPVSGPTYPEIPLTPVTPKPITPVAPVGPKPITPVIPKQTTTSEDEISRWEDNGGGIQ